MTTTSSPADHRPNPTTPIAQQEAVLRVLARVEVDPVSECWVWIRGRSGGGYGQVFLGDRRVASHRLLLADATGRDLASVAPAELACHTCDNPPCVNPAHLHWGDPQSNMTEKMVRGRYRSNGWEEKTHCPQGHRLGGLNNTAAKARAGQRQCRVCHRASQWLRRRGLDPMDDVFLDVACWRELLRTDGGRDRLAAYVLAS